MQIASMYWNVEELWSRGGVQNYWKRKGCTTRCGASRWESAKRLRQSESTVHFKKCNANVLPLRSPLTFVVDEQIRELFFQSLDLGNVTHQNVRIIWILQRIVLVIILGTVEAL